VSNDQIPGDRAPSTLAFLLSQVGIHAARRFSERIGEAIEVPPSRMVALVDELEKRDLVERRPDPDDRRVRALYLTPKGRTTLERGREIARAHERELTRGMDPADRKRLTQLLRKIVDEQTIGRGIHPGLSGKSGPPPGGKD
jgi:DNA-binding MarR family transcriptional regulator